MIIESKFRVGAHGVYAIRLGKKATTTPACDVCEGTQRVQVEVEGFGEADYACPVPRGDRNNHRPIVVQVNDVWEIERSAEVVIKVRMAYEEVWGKDADKFKPFHSNGTSYALTPDSYNSHRVWQESDLFSSPGDAQAACDSRNKEAA